MSLWQQLTAGANSDVVISLGKLMMMDDFGRRLV